MSTLSTANPALDSYGRKQHFQYGQVASGAKENLFMYGSGKSYDSPRYGNKKLDRHKSSEKFQYGVNDTIVGNPGLAGNRYPESAVIEKKKKQQQEARDRDEYLKAYQEKKRIEAEKDQEEKRQILETSKQHPFKLKDWRDENGKIPRKPSVDPELNQAIELGRYGGGGAPNKTASGKLQHAKRDPTIYFHHGSDVAGPSNNLVTDLERMAHQTRADRNVKKQGQYGKAGSLDDKKANNYALSNGMTDLDPEMGNSIVTQMGRPGGGNPQRDAKGNAHKSQSLRGGGDGAVHFGPAMYKKTDPRANVGSADHPLGQSKIVNNLWGSSVQGTDGSKSWLM